MKLKSYMIGHSSSIILMFASVFMVLGEEKPAYVLLGLAYIVLFIAFHVRDSAS